MDKGGSSPGWSPTPTPRIGLVAQPRRERAAACTASAIVDLLGPDAGSRTRRRVDPSHVAVLTRTNLEARAGPRGVAGPTRAERGPRRQGCHAEPHGIRSLCHPEGGAVADPPGVATPPRWRPVCSATTLPCWPTLTPADAEVMAVQVPDSGTTSGIAGGSPR